MRTITKEQEVWSKKKQGISPEILRELINDQKSRCELTGIPLIFDKEQGTPTKGRGCHALYATVDHKSPSKKGSSNLVKDDVQIICYAINDMKGHMPKKLFNVIRNSDEWTDFVKGWKNCSKNNNSEDYYKYIKNYDLKQ